MCGLENKLHLLLSTYQFNQLQQGILNHRSIKQHVRGMKGGRLKDRNRKLKRQKRRSRGRPGNNETKVEKQRNKEREKERDEGRIYWNMRIC